MEDGEPPALRRLQCFVETVDAGTVTAAAARLGVAQPSLSQQLRVLEAEIGAPLLERGPRGVTLTVAGRALLPAARIALDAAGRGRRAARAAAGLEAGEVCVATTQSLALGVLPAVLEAWRAETPDLVVTLREHRHLRELHADLAAGTADVALAQQPDDWPGALADAGTEELVVVLAVDDALARDARRERADRHDPRIPLAALADRGWVLPERDNGLSETIDAACAAAGFAPRAAARSASVATLVRLAGAGVGPALVPDNVLGGEPRAAVLGCDPPIVRRLAAFGPASAAALVRRLAASTAA